MQSKSRGCAPRSSNSAERVSAAAGEDGVLGLCGLSVLLDIVLCCRIGVGKLEFYRDFGLGKNEEAKSMRQVAGELNAVIQAYKWAKDNGYKNINIFI